ncbi:VOC family protein [Paenibacillus tarimensis]
MQANEEIKVEQKVEDITGVTCIYVPVNDVCESIKWYQKNLGCEPTKIHPVEPGMKMAIMRFSDHNGNFPGPGLRQTVPALFLHESGEEGGRLGFSWTLDGGKRHAVACFITPRIQELFERFKENGVNILGDIRQTCGPNLLFSDPDGNLWEVWQP